MSDVNKEYQRRVTALMKTAGESYVEMVRPAALSDEPGTHLSLMLLANKGDTPGNDVMVVIMDGPNIDADSVRDAIQHRQTSEMAKAIIRQLHAEQGDDWMKALIERTTEAAKKEAH